MKKLTVLGALLLMYCGCISQSTQNPESIQNAQNMQKERENLLESYGEIRRDQDKQTHEFAVQDLLIGKWELVSLTFEEGDVPEPKLAIKVSLAATARQNLTLEFFKEYARYGFSGTGSGIQVGGDYDIRSLLYGEELYPIISFTRRQGETMERFLFGEAATRDESDVPFSRTLVPGISVSFSKGESGSDDLLHLMRYGRMELRPEGWVRTGHIHSIFKKIK